MSSPDRHLGLTGLATMGANLARNVAHHDIPVAVHNRTQSKTERFMDEHGDEGPLEGTGSSEEFVAALAPPRAIIVMVKAGAPVFGAHTYRRVDRDGTFHTLWGEDGSEVQAD